MRTSDAALADAGKFTESERRMRRAVISKEHNDLGNYLMTTTFARARRPSWRRARPYFSLEPSSVARDRARVFS